jgi:hypothetical protein
MNPRDTCPTFEDREATESRMTLTDERISEEIRCKYPGKFCGQARVRKSTGTFHRYCQYHRDKASANQKRWTSVRRQQAAAEDHQRFMQELLALRPQIQPSSLAMLGSSQAASRCRVLLPDPIGVDHCPESEDLSLEDAMILSALLVGEPNEVIFESESHPPTSMASFVASPTPSHRL